MHGNELTEMELSAMIRQLKLDELGHETDPDSLAKEDPLELEIEESPPYELQVSEDQLSAHFLLNRTNPQAVHLHDVMARLQQEGIRANLNLAAVVQELKEPTYEPVLAAQGKPAVPGQDARLEIYFPEQVESHFFEVNGSIDFRNHLRIPSVHKGDIIAKKFPMTEGVPGLNVYGEVLLPKLPRDVVLVAKPNVLVGKDGAIIALKDGRPQVTGGSVKTFDITTTHVVEGNVDLTTGNIVFSGDVIICGDVTDNMIVESLGNVYVYGSVYNATLTATGSIHIRGNAVGSKLYSGYYGVLYNRLYQATRWLSTHIEQLNAAARMLAFELGQRNQTARWGQLVLLLIENKFKEVPHKVRELLSVLTSIQQLNENQFQQLREQSYIFCQNHLLLDTVTYPFMRKYGAMLRDVYREVELMKEDRVVTMINQCHNSELKSNGDIIIVRDGVILSDLYAAGSIIFRYERSVCRGSRLEAGHSILAKTAGGQTGTAALLIAKVQISVDRMYSGRLCVGKYNMEIDEVADNLTLTRHGWKRNSAISPRKAGVVKA